MAGAYYCCVEAWYWHFPSRIALLLCFSFPVFEAEPQWVVFPSSYRDCDAHGVWVQWCVASTWAVGVARVLIKCELPTSFLVDHVLCECMWGTFSLQLAGSITQQPASQPASDLPRCQCYGVCPFYVIQLQWTVPTIPCHYQGRVVIADFSCSRLLFFSGWIAHRGDANGP